MYIYFYFDSIVIRKARVIQSIGEEMRNISIVRDLCLRKHSGVLVEQASSGNAIIIPVQEQLFADRNRWKTVAIGTYLGHQSREMSSGNKSVSTIYFSFIPSPKLFFFALYANVREFQPVGEIKRLVAGSIASIGEKKRKKRKREKKTK